ncbi:MAG: hypothetical protein JHC81_04260 [Brevundimonas sp.]|uniref:hypothetical protein n=1 Tax=Brevundimonas sp. TaxID=1871086 RepID=UPI001A33E301|nr:hypothetical protein [Brevundimonas sp.]MBJ7446727.1 hypothetical protein [Brevundimonas sp.]
MSDDELSAMAIEELDAACAMPWSDLKAVTPWGDIFTGFAPSGREVEVERRYLWAHQLEGAVAVEVEVRDMGARTGAEAKALITPPA